MKKFPHYHICEVCAKERGGTPSPGVHTMAAKTCQYCHGNNQTEKFISPWVDYNWDDDASDAMAKVYRD